MQTTAVDAMERGPGTDAVATGAGPGPLSHVRERLEEQLAWYDRKAAGAKRWYLRLKVVQIVVAAAIPVLAAADVPVAVAGALGAVVVVLEGVQQLFQFQQVWTAYRSTCESLKHEKFLFLATAGPYAGAARPEALLAERVEGLVSQEHAAWVSERREAAARAAEPVR